MEPRKLQNRKRKVKRQLTDTKNDKVNSVLMIITAVGIGVYMAFGAGVELMIYGALVLVFGLTSFMMK